jgi:hypothetical protein
MSARLFLLIDQDHTLNAVDPVVHLRLAGQNPGTDITRIPLPSPCSPVWRPADAGVDREMPAFLVGRSSAICPLCPPLLIVAGGAETLLADARDRVTRWIDAG